ncbi:MULTISPECIES: ATP-binding protein [unclassified Pseudomonas]|uniref:ATP-binding protein n=1 Tax=unclassified Pseudomonas TaxID=196821 RepID=UPI0025E9B2DB|nr:MULTISPECIES: ATP-binding protein [unclassified Pseudomonas]
MSESTHVVKGRLSDASVSTLHTARRQVRMRQGFVVRYLGAVVVVALCGLIRAQMPGTALPYLFFIPGLMFCGFWFGTGASIVGCALAVLTAQYFFIGSVGFEHDGSSWGNTFSFGLVSLAMAMVCHLFRQNLNALYRANMRLEEEVERRTQERNDVWNVSPDLICTLSENGQLLAANPAWQVETGWTEGELAQGRLWEFISAEQLAVALQTLNTLTSVELDTECVRRDGKHLQLNWRIARRQGRYLAVARDVTLFKERQETLEQVRSQLQQSQKMEAVGQLTGGLAHDFNNLLTVIGGSLEMLQRRIAQGKFEHIERYVAAAQGASSRAAALTHRLLTYSRRQTLASKVVAPALLMQDMQELISRTLTPLIELELLAPATVLLCLCDAHQLENAVLNLCINARDAMPRGGRLRIEVSEVRITSQTDALALDVGDYALIRVTDTGTGMPESILQRAFDPFFTTKPLGAGSGLGLSMVHGFARQSSGDVRISSAVGKGTTVSLFLPIYQGASPTAAAGTPVIAGDGTIVEQGSVLVVDDEAAIRDLVGEALQEVGYHIIKAGTADEALRLLAELPSLTLLVTDIGLPGGTSGHELATLALKKAPSLKVLFISGFSENAVPTSAFEDGRVHWLPKPFAMSELKAAIDELFSAA